LKNFNAEDRKRWEVINTHKVINIFPEDYWKRLFARCIDIIFRARSAEAIDFVPVEYMCPITLDWFHDPVVAASGVSYSRDAINEHLESNKIDPVTRVDLTDTPLYANITLRRAVEHYRLHFGRFRVLA
ncbi:E3 ubiquitin-protein ligase, partial [Tetrabaena socialis]